MAVTNMIKRKVINVTLIVMSVVILIGVALTIYFSTSDRHIIKISIEPDQTQAIRFEELYLRPGENCEYILSLSSEQAEVYRLVLCFEDQDPTLTLKDYAYVRMEKGGEVLCDIRLSEAFEQAIIECSADFTDNKKDDVKIIYYIPENVGNDAQNAEADFKLLVRGTNG